MSQHVFLCLSESGDGCGPCHCLGPPFGMTGIFWGLVLERHEKTCYDTLVSFVGRLGSWFFLRRPLRSDFGGRIASRDAAALGAVAYVSVAPRSDAQVALPP